MKRTVLTIILIPGLLIMAYSNNKDFKEPDYLEVEKNEYNIEGFYFDINMVLQK